MACTLKGSQFFFCAPRVHPLSNEPHLPLPSQPKLALIYRPRRDGRLSWPWAAGWLHTEINVRHRELNQYTVAHLSTNRARRILTSLIETNALTTTPDHQTLTLRCRTWFPSLDFKSSCCITRHVKMADWRAKQHHVTANLGPSKRRAELAAIST